MFEGPKPEFCIRCLSNI